MKTKPFHNKRMADAFAKDVRGFVEGPFIDEHLEQTYIVFYKERRTRWASQNYS